MAEQQASYRQIMKATSIFGGVQVYNVIISIIRSKFIAVLLGPTGMGIANLLISTTDLVGKITNLGLSTSAVRNVAAANASGDKERIATVVSVLRRLVWLTGILGTLFTLFLAPRLSELTFGNKDYTFAFIWLSITLLLTQVNAGQLVVLQGMRRINFLAKANMAGNTMALLTSVPIYYFLGLKGIVPAIIISAVTLLFFSWYYSSKVEVQTKKINKADLFSEGGDMIKMGFFLSLSSLMSVGTAYILRIYISHKGGVEQVGLFTAGFAIISTYVGLVFTAMSKDFFPSLSGIAHKNEEAKSFVNQQAEIAILILAPILTFFLIFMYFIVILLYSNKFIPVNEMMHWAALGIYFKAASWPISYLIIAKGHTRTFFFSELITKFYITGLNIAGYLWKGLEGLGISYFVGFVFYSIHVSILSYSKYGFSFEKQFYKIIGIQFMLGTSCFIISRFVNPPYMYFFGSILILASCLYSFKELDKRLNLMLFIREKFKKPN